MLHKLPMTSSKLPSLHILHSENVSVIVCLLKCLAFSQLNDVWSEFGTQGCLHWSAEEEKFVCAHLTFDWRPNLKPEFFFFFIPCQWHKSHSGEAGAFTQHNVQPSESAPVGVGLEEKYFHRVDLCWYIRWQYPSWPLFWQWAASD